MALIKRPLKAKSPQKSKTPSTQPAEAPKSNKPSFLKSTAEMTPEEYQERLKNSSRGGSQAARLQKPYTVPRFLENASKVPGPRQNTLDALGRDSRLIGVRETKADRQLAQFQNDEYYRKLYMAIAEEIKDGTPIQEVLESFGVSTESFYLLLSNSDEYAEMCGRKQRLKFKWDNLKFDVANALADGMTHVEIEALYGVAKRTIARWLNIRDFAEYLDSLIMESGLANRRVRVATTKRISEKLMGTVLRKLDRLDSDGLLDDESAKGLLTEFREFAKLLAEEKRELVHLVESVNVNTTTVEGTVKHKVEPVNNFLENLTDDAERVAAEQAIREAADELINRYG